METFIYLLLIAVLGFMFYRAAKTGVITLRYGIKIAKADHPVGFVLVCALYLAILLWAIVKLASRFII